MLLCLGLLAGEVRSASAQEPADTVPPVPADSTLTDSLRVDSIADVTQMVDSLPDSLRVVNLPDLPAGPPPGAARGVWEWDREALLRVRRPTLVELLARVPGLTLLRGGDYGMPVTVAPFGASGGGLRVFVDGIEWEPLDGSVPDLARFTLRGLNRVRVTRTGTDVRVELETLRFTEPDPVSLIEVGTGDLETNLFGATFALPRAFGGALAVSLDRVDTQGRVREDPGSQNGAWVRYTWVPGETVGLEVDYRVRNVDRNAAFEPAEVRRQRVAVLGRWQPHPALLASAHYSRTGLSTENTDGDSFSSETVSQYGVGLAARNDVLHASADLRLFDGTGQVDRTVDLEATLHHPRLGSVSGAWRGGWWPDGSASRVSAQAWTAPLAGFSAFAGVDMGASVVRRPPPFTGFPEPYDVVIPLAPPVDSTEAEPVPSAADRDALRLGGLFAWRGLELGGARLRVEADSLFPTGLPMDRDGSPRLTSEERRSGWEAWVRIPIPILDGLAIRGWAVRWDSVAGDPYLPKLTYDAALSFHDTFLPTENFELLFDVGVEGRDGMEVMVVEDSEADPPDLLTTVPFYQSWYARLQLRIVTVHIFANWDNFTIRDRNRDFPERLLPRTRASYGVRWTLRN